MNNENIDSDSYDYCEHCDQLIWKPEMDYSPSDSGSFSDFDYSMDETMDDLDFGIVPLGAIKRTRSEAGLEDNLQKPGSKKRQRLESSDPMDIDFSTRTWDPNPLK